MRTSDSEVIASSMTHPIEFAAIFDRHVDPVRRFVARRLGARRADDVVSEVFRIHATRAARSRLADGRLWQRG
jgi:DNA-directed RNA polymerase specialized sigma24 family protein